MKVLEPRRVGDGDGAAAIGLALVAVGVGQVLGHANAELYELVSYAVELRLSTSDGLNSLEDLVGGVGASWRDATLAEEGEQVHLTLELDGVVEVVMLAVDVGTSGTGAVLVVLVSPETLLVVALQIRPYRLQRGDQVSDVLCIEVGTAVAGPSAVVVLRPKTMDHPVVETRGS